MLDLVCRRYPVRRPSDYLELDEYTGIQLDFAMAFRYDHLEAKERIEHLEAVQEMIKPLGMALGVKYEKKKSTVTPGTPVSDDIPIDVALALFGAGKGTVIVDGTK